MNWLDQVWREALAPRILPPTSAEPGPWRTARTPYLADALISGSPWERVVLINGAQLGAIEAALNWIGCIIAHAPASRCSSCQVWTWDAATRAAGSIRCSRQHRRSPRRS